MPNNNNVFDNVFYIELPEQNGSCGTRNFGQCFSTGCKLCRFLKSKGTLGNPVYRRTGPNGLFLLNPNSMMTASDVLNLVQGMLNTCEKECEKQGGQPGETFHIELPMVTCPCKGQFDKLYPAGCALKEFILSGRTMFTYDPSRNRFGLVPHYPHNVDGLGQAVQDLKTIQQICAKCIDTARLNNK